MRGEGERSGGHRVADGAAPVSLIVHTLPALVQPLAAVGVGEVSFLLLSVLEAPSAGGYGNNKF